MRLDDININYLIVSTYSDNDSQVINEKNNSNLESYLYNKGYSLINICGYCGGVTDESIIAYKYIDNNSLRMDSIDIINKFSQDSAIIKYKGDGFNKILNNGSEIPLSISTYNNNENNNLLKKSYFSNGLTFSFVEKKRYYVPSSKKDFRVGMVVEILNNKNEWVKKLVENPEDEWDKLYKLLVKYNKVRY